MEAWCCRKPQERAISALTQSCGRQNRKNEASYLQSCLWNWREHLLIQSYLGHMKLLPALSMGVLAFSVSISRNYSITKLTMVVSITPTSTASPPSWETVSLFMEDGGQGGIPPSLNEALVWCTMNGVWCGWSFPCFCQLRCGMGGMEVMDMRPFLTLPRIFVILCIFVI